MLIQKVCALSKIAKSKNKYNDNLVRHRGQLFSKSFLPMNEWDTQSTQIHNLWLGQFPSWKPILPVILLQHFLVIYRQSPIFFICVFRVYFLCEKDMNLVLTFLVILLKVWWIELKRHWFTFLSLCHFSLSYRFSSKSILIYVIQCTNPKL